MDYSPPGSSVHGDSLGKNTGVTCHALHQGIFPTQKPNPGFPNCRQTLYQLSHQGNPNTGYLPTKWVGSPVSRPQVLSVSNRLLAATAEVLHNNTSHCNEKTARQPEKASTQQEDLLQPKKKKRPCLLSSSVVSDPL